jgi:hypothetical protein
MISTAIALVMFTAAPEDASSVRSAYSRCLKEVVKTSVEKKLALTSFDSAVAAACADKEAQLKALLIKSGAATGLKRAVSEQATAEELRDYRTMAKEDFQAELASAPQP